MKIFSKKRLIIIIAGILLLFGLNLFQSETYNFFYSLSSPIQTFFWEKGSKASTFMAMISETRNFKEKTKEIKQQNQKLLAENAALKEIREENIFLRKALNLDLQDKFSLRLGKIIAKNPIRDRILINKGKKDEIKKNNPVINQNKVLIGRIEKVYENFSWVALISSSNVSFNVRVGSPSDNKSEPVLAEGRGQQSILVDLIPAKKTVKKGDVVFTSRLGKKFPGNLLVGEITTVKKKDVNPFQKAIIEPFFDVSTIDNLFIVTNF